MRYMRRVRKEKGISSSEVANMLGVSVRAYQCYESGHRDPSFASMEKLEDLYGVSYRELLKVL